MNDLAPLAGEPLNLYLKRLRERAGMSQADVMRATEHLPGPQRITSWLARVEKGDFAHPDAEKLAVLAEVYSERLKAEVPLDLLREMAGYETRSTPATDAPAWSATLATRSDLHELVQRLLDLPAEDLSAVATMVHHLWSRTHATEQLYADRQRSADTLDTLESSGLRPRRERP